MGNGSERTPPRTAGEWAFRSESGYAAPFADVHLDAMFTAASVRTATMPAFYDGDDTWRVRFNPDEVGRWTFRTVARVSDRGLEREGSFHVVPYQSRGFTFESGDPVFVRGDTTYNLFGMAHRGIDVAPFLRRRADQGFNLPRVRLPVSPFHPPAGYSHWQARRTWPWGGSEQAPRFDQINGDYFRTVDGVVRQANALGLGLEMIMEGWGFEFPFNSRQIFLPEWEELWLRVARRLSRPGRYPRLREFVGSVGEAGRGPARSGRPAPRPPFLHGDRPLCRAATDPGRDLQRKGGRWRAAAGPGNA